MHLTKPRPRKGFAGDPCVLRAYEHGSGTTRTTMAERIRKALKAAAVLLGLAVLGVLGLQGAEWVSSKVLASGVERVHRAVGSLRAGMRRPDVERALASLAPALSRPSRLDSGVLSSHFKYTATEACYVTMIFKDDQLVGVSVSDANQPGHCPRAPPDWHRDEHLDRPSGPSGTTTAPARGSCMCVAPQNNALQLTSGAARMDAARS
jgi:hypothetical protein